jgi:hypothetical protein
MGGGMREKEEVGRKERQNSEDGFYILKRGRAVMEMFL